MSFPSKRGSSRLGEEPGKENEMSRTGLLPRRVANIARAYTGAVKVVASAAVAANDIVVVSGVSGSKMTVALADADAAATRSPTLMVSPFAIPLNEVGAVVPWAIIKNVATNGSAIGNPVYLSSTAGGWSLATPSAATASTIRVGTVLSVHASTGVILLNPGAHDNRAAAEGPPGGDALPSTPILMMKEWPAGNANTDFLMPNRKTRVIDVWTVSADANGGQVQLEHTAGGDVTNSWNPGNANAVVRATLIFLAQDSFAANESARIDSDASTPPGTMYILLMPE